METFGGSFAAALRLVVTADMDLLGIVWLSLKVSLSATAAAAVIGLPLGAILATRAFVGRGLAIATVNALMGLPPVVVGLAVYLALSASGPFGVLGLLYTPAAMILAQTVLVAPIVAALSRQVIADLDAELGETLAALGASGGQRMMTLLWEGRFALATVLLAGLGRALAEVGAVMIVGGNIDQATRVMTTAIALETSRGDLPLALGLGIVLLTMTLALNMMVQGLRLRLGEVAHA